MTDLSDSFMLVLLYQIECKLNASNDLKKVKFQSEEANTDEELKKYLKKYLIENNTINNTKLQKLIVSNDGENQEIKKQLDVARGIENGLSELKNKPTPDFEFKNHKGGTTKLSSLKGKIVYVDIWAVWCAPCRIEIPYLKKLEEDFKNQNIDFVSISIDELKDVKKWKKFVTEKDLKGIQLLADNAWQTQWIKHFKITGIPRFIIIGKDGKVLEPDAPKPSAPETATTLSNLLK